MVERGRAEGSWSKKGTGEKGDGVKRTCEDESG